MYVPQLPSLLYSKPVHPSRCLHVCAQFSIPFPGLDQDFPFPFKFNDMCLKPQPHLTSQEESNESIHILVNQCLLRPCIIRYIYYQKKMSYLWQHDKARHWRSPCTKGCVPTVNSHLDIYARTCPFRIFDIHRHGHHDAFQDMENLPGIDMCLRKTSIMQIVYIKFKLLP